MKPSDIDRRGLEPQQYEMSSGKRLHYFVDNHIELIRLDIVFNAGTALQDKKFQSAAAINLVTEGSARHTAREIAEFLDFRGIVMDKGNDVTTSTLTVYTLSRYLAELLPFLFEVVSEASYPQEEFDVFMLKRRQQLLTNMHKTSYIARISFNSRVYGPTHPMGAYAVPDDIAQLTVDDVRRFHSEFMRLQDASLVVSGAVNDEVLRLIDKEYSKYTGTLSTAILEPFVPEPQSVNAVGYCPIEVPGAVQNTIRVGRLLPMRWDDSLFSQFMVLSTTLGGYFGSRLMSNIREDKGYTYGVNAMTHVRRGSIAFYIVTDVAADKAEPAMDEIRREIGRLRCEAIPDEELQMVRNNMLGDFMRSIDGIFERAERFIQMKSSGIDERFTDNFMATLEDGAVSSSQLQELASEILDPDKLLFISAGHIPQQV